MFTVLNVIQCGFEDISRDRTSEILRYSGRPANPRGDSPFKVILSIKGESKACTRGSYMGFSNLLLILCRNFALSQNFDVLIIWYISEVELRDLQRWYQFKAQKNYPGSVKGLLVDYTKEDPRR